ncbi:Aggregate silk glue, partial [Araneus ventricosus]
PGTTPGVVTGPDGQPVKYIVPQGAYTTPGSIPGPHGKPIHVKPAGPGTTPGAKTNSDGSIDSIVLPTTPKGSGPGFPTTPQGSGPGFEFQTPQPITKPDGQPIQIVPAG